MDNNTIPNLNMGCLRVRSPIFVRQIKKIAKQMDFLIGVFWELQSVEELPDEQRDEFLLKLMKTNNAVAIRQTQDEMDLYLFPAVKNYLLSQRLKVLDLTGFFTFCLKENAFTLFKTLMPLISSSAPNLEELLVFNKRLPHRWATTDTFFKGEDDRVFSAFASLKKLRVLQLELFAFYLTDLMDICAAVPRLQYLNVNLTIACTQPLPKGCQLQECMSNVRVFLYSVVSTETGTHSKFQLLCFEYLRDLQIFYQFIKDFTVAHEIDASFWVAPPGCTNLCHVSLVKAFHLKLLVKTNVGYLTHLALDWRDFKPFLNDFLLSPNALSKLKGLELSHFPREKCDLVLSACGPNLLELYLHSTEVGYERIFKKCVNLEKIANMSLFPRGEGIKFFAKVREIKVQLYSIRFSNILCASRLEKVTICEIHCKSREVESLQWLVSKMAFQLILQQLHTLIFEMDWLDLDVLEARTFQRVAQVIKVADGSLPSLVVLQLHLNNYCDYLLLADSLMEESVTVEDVRRIGPVFEPLRTKEDLDWALDRELIDVLKSRQ